MRVHSTDDVDEYAAAARPFLEAEPCARNVLLTVIDTVRSAPASYSDAPGFWWVTDADAVVGAMSWTPPHNLLVSSLPAEAAPGLAAAAIERARRLGLRPGGVVGPATSARAVAAAWTSATDDRIARDRTILLNELHSLTEVAVPRGARRSAVEDDATLVTAWLAASTAEIDHAAIPNPRVIADHMIRAGHIDLWVTDDQPVSMAGHRIAAGVVRVGPVYTPREHRNHGYARRLTYEVTAAVIARPDVHRAMLFTDAANPVSNSIYRQAGYEPRGEHVEIDFVKRSAASAH
jgi:predicted GNAT family acetyltransferase